MCSAVWHGSATHEVSRSSQLCVHADGTVGEGYGKAIAENHGGDMPEDLNMHAAIERFGCYQHFGAAVPADGGSPALTAQVAARRNRVRTQAANGREVQRTVCSSCHLLLPMSGQCDTCS